MSQKRIVQSFQGFLDEDGLVIPNSAVIMKGNFKRELAKYFLASLKRGQKILDLNPGLHGIYDELDLSQIAYVALEQNSRIRSFLEERHIAVLNWKIPKVPLENNSVDFVLSAAFLEHLPTYVDAFNVLLEMRRVLTSEGRILVIVPNYLRIKDFFFEDYKHGWVTTRKRVIDMLNDCHFEIIGSRYTLGWITMRTNLLVSFLRLFLSLSLALLRINFVDRILETFKLERLSYRFQKTFFELVAIEARVKK